MLVTLEVEGEFVSITCGELGFDKRRTFIVKEILDLSHEYRRACEASDPLKLLDTGRALYRWLDGPEDWLTTLRPNLRPPFQLEVRAALNPGPNAMTILHAPWELLADELGFLAQDAILQFSPARRLGKTAQPGPLDDFRLGIAFMASSPRGEGAPELDFEAEESAIMVAARQGLDLLVEDSGDPEQLGERLAAIEHQPPVLHLSCHGHNAWKPAGGGMPRPVLVMETERGNPRPIDAGELIAALNPFRPRLLFLSACLTAAGGASEADSMACALIRAGFPAVLGWDGSVADLTATAFAAEFYEGLAKRQPVVQAAAAARLTLLGGSNAASLPQPFAGARSEYLKDWHLARVWLGPDGGGPIIAGRLKRSLLPPDHGHKQLLTRKGDDRLAVADPAVFVGRRHELQEALRVLKDDEKSGVLLHGMGRLGKSSLAARIANRMRDHRLVIVYGAYDALSLFDALAAELGDYPPARDLLAERRPAVGDSPQALKYALIDLLQGPCAQEGSGRAVLLLVDDLERILEPDERTGKYQVRAAERPVIAALLEAFDVTRTESRLLMTSRYPFELAENGVRLDPRLHQLQLPPFGPRARDKLRLRQLMQAGHRPKGETSLSEKDLEARIPLLQKATELARGNPGLQDLIGDRLVLNASVPAERVELVLAQMGAYLSGGDLPQAEEVRTFLQNLAVDELLAQAGDGGRALLRAASLFDLPVPPQVLDALAGSVGGDVTHLRELGLLDPFEDPVDHEITSFAVNGLAKGRIEALNDADWAAFATIAVPVLFTAWGGAAGREQRPIPTDILLARLALFAGNEEVLASCAGDAVSGLSARYMPAVAAALGLGAIARLEAAGIFPGLRLLARTAEALETIGQGGEASATLAKGLDRLNDPDERDTAEMSNFLFHLGNRQVTEGQLDQAQATFERLCELEKSRENRHAYAVARGRVAEVLRQRGDLDEALRIHREERLPIYTEVDDIRAIALTQGAIADILYTRGDFDEVLRIRREEELPVYTRLGDVHSLAVTQGQIADILMRRDELDAALEILRDELLPVFARLDDAHSSAACKGRIASIMARQGRGAEARALLTEKLDASRKLNDADGIASSLFDLAKIDWKEEEYQTAVERLCEAWPILTQYDRAEGIAAVGDWLGRILFEVGDFEAARDVLTRTAAAWRKLGREAEAKEIETILGQLPD